MSILALNKVNYSYKNGKKVLNDISMEFEKGKFYAILGVSGSGKTTLFRHPDRCRHKQALLDYG